MTTTAAPATDLYSEHVNPQWVRLLNLLQMNVRYQRCAGAELFMADGARVLDFLSGYCVHNAGHNHPRIVRALHEELDRSGPAMLQSHVPGLAGELAERLGRLAGGGLRKAFFACSGSEGVETAIKFARANTGRTGLLYADGAFHGLTCGALSLMGNKFWRGKFGTMLPDTEAIPFNDIAALEERLAIAVLPHFSRSPFKRKPASAFRTKTTFVMQNSSVHVTARCSCWMRCRPACSAPAAFWPLIISAWKRT